MYTTCFNTATIIYLPNQGFSNMTVRNKNIISTNKMIKSFRVTYPQWIDVYGIKQVRPSTNFWQQFFGNRLFTRK